MTRKDLDMKGTSNGVMDLRERETYRLVDYLECIRENFGNDHPDHASSSKTRTERQDFVECVGAEERWDSNNGLRFEKQNYISTCSLENTRE